MRFDSRSRRIYLPYEFGRDLSCYPAILYSILLYLFFFRPTSHFPSLGRSEREDDRRGDGDGAAGKGSEVLWIRRGGRKVHSFRPSSAYHDPRLHTTPHQGRPATILTLTLTLTLTRTSLKERKEHTRSSKRKRKKKSHLEN